MHFYVSQIEKQLQRNYRYTLWKQVLLQFLGCLRLEQAGMEQESVQLQTEMLTLAQPYSCMHP